VKVTYKCNSCGKITTIDCSGKIGLNIKCECGSNATRVFCNIGLDKEEDSVSGAKQLMLYSTNPTGRCLGV
jgi:DNA-directed RNA polymerase subunit RPC12/RpoP